MNITLTVQGMTCEHCEEAVKNAVNELIGVSNVSINLTDKTVAVSFAEDQVNAEQIKEAIEDQGYDVEG